MIKNQFYIFIGMLIFFSFFSYTYYNLLPANIIFEVLVLVAFCLVAKRMTSHAWIIVAICIVYITYTIGEAYLAGVHLRDYFLAYKTFFYLIILGFFCRKTLFNQRYVIRLYWLILAAFLLKYIIWLFVADFDRPGVFAENNFELLFLLLFSLAVYTSVGALSKIEISLLVLVFFLSGSRSGIVSIFVMFCILYVRSFSFKTIITLIFLGLLGVGGTALFIERLSGGGLESIDRFVFLQGFILSISNWGVLDYFTGSDTLTALPSEVCSRLSFYKTLFSAADPSVCYSAVLHSYILRVIFDHGIVGLCFIFYSIWLFMKLSFVPKRVALSVLAILFLNGLSVSSVNSVYAILGLIFLLTAQKNNFRMQASKTSQELGESSEK